MTSVGVGAGRAAVSQDDGEASHRSRTGASRGIVLDAAAPEDSTMTVVSVQEEGNQIAFACYDEALNTITMEQSRFNPAGDDIEELIERFYLATRPNMVLLGNKTAANSFLLSALTRPPPQTEEDGENTPPQQQSHANSSIPYQTLKGGSFDIEKSRILILQKLRVLDLLRNQPRPNRDQLVNIPAGHFQPSSYHSLASVVDFESTVVIRTLGALVSFLQSTLFRMEQGNTVTVNSIQQANSCQYMRISSNTLQALHIFSTEHHPLLAKGQGHSKEGFSLFSLLDRTKSKMGRECLRNWMLKPLTYPEHIRCRHDGVELFLEAQFQSHTETILKHLEQCGSIDRILCRMTKCQATGNDFIVLSRSLSSAIAIYHALQVDLVPKLTQLLQQSQMMQQQQEFHQEGIAQEEKYQAYWDFLQSVLQRCSVQSLLDVQARITDIIDEEATLERRNSVIIKMGFHEELDAAKEKFESLDSILKDAGDETVAHYPQLRHCSAVFITQLGFLMSIEKSEHQWNDKTNSFPGLPQDFQFIFVDATKAYYKNDYMSQLDENIGDLLSIIQDTEAMIVNELEDDILDHETDLRATFYAIAELDCILCFAACAENLGFTRPIMLESRERCIQIQNGRHPLQEIIVDGHYVPNDTAIDSRNRINVVTGPNFSGKSCYTRQVGVIVYMAHIGCFVPCEKADIAITDQILARISTVETCAVPQSSFQLEMTEMGTILRRSTPFSLVLIDEFGKGTSPSSGIAILVAVLKKLASLKCKVICTTHFLEIFSLNLVRDGVGAVKAFQMTINIPQTKRGLATPLFKIQPGVAESSAGLLCAEKAGLNRDIVNRARDILGGLRDGSQVAPVEEIFNPPLDISPDAKEALDIFLRVNDWKEASEESLRRLMHHIARM
jgi:DNA mismatch repair protein MSH5